MRLWHYKLIPYLPKSQLLAQWRELNSIIKNQNDHILINYVYDYPINDLYNYTALVVEEMMHRGFKVNTKVADDYFITFRPKELYHLIKHPFKKHHNDRYLLQCFYNLQEKYDRGQKDFSDEEYKRIEKIIERKIKYECKNND